MQNFRSLGAPPPDPLASSSWGLCPETPKAVPHCEFLATRLFCVDADDYVGQSLINTIFEAGKTKRAFYVINLNWLNQ